MNKEPLPQKEVRAYREAAHALAGQLFGAEMLSVSIRSQSDGIRRSQFAKLSGLCNLKKPRADHTRVRILDYVIVRLAGSVGELIRVERHHGVKYRSAPQKKLERRYLRKLRECEDADLDVAFACAFGWLGHLDGGDPRITLEKIWKRTDRLFRYKVHGQRLEKIALRLLEVEEMTDEELNRFVQ